MKRLNSYSPSDIAIIGIGCRFPGNANDVNSFWDNLINGVDATTDVPNDRWNKDIHFRRDRAIPGKLSTYHGGFLNQIDCFDANFFGFSPREAAYMDPQQRLLLEVAWEALEDAGIIPGTLKGKDVGVYIGAFTTDFQILQFKSENIELVDTHTATGMMMTILSNRLSHFFDFRGPSMTIDTACSSSLVALHLGCQALLQNECSIALIGGVNVFTSPDYSISESKGGFLSPDGRSKAFDEKANGYARGEGAGIVVLRKLANAIENNDSIYAVIKATGVNQDGHTNGITVPRGESQEMLLKSVYNRAGISPGDISYFEAHGTGTPVGDPIEAMAIGNVLREGRKNGNKCFVGSVKTNIGHLEAAAGMAGLIKSCLILQNKIIPPNLHFNKPNPKIPFEDLCIQIPTKIQQLNANGKKALVGVNSFGFGGTNAHVILEEAPLIKAQNVDVQKSGCSTTLIVLSGHSEKACETTAAILKDFIAHSEENVSIHDIASSFAFKKTLFDFRIAFPARSKRDCLDYLEAYLNHDERKGLSCNKIDSDKIGKIAFVYTGMGPIWWAMARQLLNENKIFRTAIDNCDAAIKKYAGWSVIDVLSAEETESRIDQPQFAQPANFAVQVGFTELWKSLGIIPDAMVGHSVGEVSAAYASGILNLDQAAMVSIERSLIQQKAVGKGTMLAVGLSEQEALFEVQPFGEDVSIAAINSQKSVTLTGLKNHLEIINEKLQKNGVFSRFMKVDIAYHSNQMDPYRIEINNALESMKTVMADIAIYSTVSGKISGKGDYGAEYWWNNVRQPVRFKDAIDNMLNDNIRTFIEIGPHPVLASSIKECLQLKGVSGLIIPSLRRNEDDEATIFSSAAQLMTMGFPFDLNKLYPEPYHFIRLPHYPWQRERHWFESEESMEMRIGKNRHPILGRRLRLPKPIWENEINLETSYYLQDHMIQDALIFPGAGYIDMAFAFIDAYYPTDNCYLENINFHKALFIKPGQYPVVQFHFNPDELKFEIFSRILGEEKKWQLNASGRICKQIGANSRVKDSMEQLKRDFVEELSQKECYSRFRKYGFQYGESFQTIDKAYVGNGYFLSQIKVKESEYSSVENQRIHPLIIDACFQGMIGVLDQLLLKNKSFSGKQFLPVGIDSFHLYNSTVRNMWSYFKISSEQSETIRGDISLFDEEGNRIALIEGFQAQASTSTGAMNTLNAQRNSFFDLEWVEQKEIINGNNFAKRDVENAHIPLYLIFESQKEIGKWLASALEKSGIQCIRLLAGVEFRIIEPNKLIQLNPAEITHYQRLFDDINREKIGRVEAIIHAWNLDAANHEIVDSDQIMRFQEKGCISVLNLAKILDKTNSLAKIWILTRGVHAINGEIGQQALFQAPVWGIGKVIGYQELVNNFGGLIDLDPQETSEEINDILQEMTNNRSEYLVAFRNRSRYVLRIKPSPKVPSQLPAKFRKDKGYLITGSFGALGMRIAKWLVENGAKHIILLGRTEIPPRDQWAMHQKDEKISKAISFINELENTGAITHFATVDIANSKQLKVFLDEYERGGNPQISGIFHTAGIVRDKPIRDMDFNTFVEVLKPKIMGSWNLCKEFDSKPLDFFILFSSVSSVINITAGQANYASANMFMDILSHFQKAKGMNCVSINWGPWSEIGMASAYNLATFYEKRGIGLISPSMGMNILGDLLSYNKAQVLVLPAQWSKIATSFQGDSIPLIADLVVADRKEEATNVVENKKETNFLEELRSADEHDIGNKMTDQLLTIISKSFKIEKCKLDPMESLSALGLDSMLATEIISRIQNIYHLSFPMIELIQGISIEELSNRMVPLVRKSNSSEASKFTEYQYPVATAHKEDIYKPFPITDVQMAYFTGRTPEVVLGGVGTHIYMEVRSTLDLGRIEESFNMLIQKHPMLRAVVEEYGLQRIIKDVPPFRIKIINVEHLNAKTQEEKILQQRSQISHQVFNPEKWPLFSITALQLSEKTNYVFISLDMLCLDGTSWQLIGQQLFKLYNNPSAEIKENKLTFRDYMLAYGQLKVSTKYEFDKKYWIDKLETFPSAPELPMRIDPSAIKIPKFKRLSKVFSPIEWSKILNIAKIKNISASTILCSIFAQVMAFWSNQLQIAINCTLFNKFPFLKDEENIVGDFTSLLVLGIIIDPNKSFWENVETTQKTLVEALEHRHYDGVEFIREIARKRGLQNNVVAPIVFTSMLTNSGYGMEGWHKFGNVELELSQTPQVILDNQLHEVNDELHITWDYVEALFEEEDILMMFQQYISMIEVLAEGEKKEISTMISCGIDFITNYNNTFLEIQQSTLQGLFRAQVLRSPNNVALKKDNEEITYKNSEKNPTRLQHI